MRRDDIKGIISSLGPRGFVHAFADLLEGRDQSGREVPKLRPESLSIRALWEACVGPVEETLPSYMPGGRFSFIEPHQLMEAIDSTTFPTATGVLIASRVIDAYNGLPTIGDQLVTVMPSRLKSERFIGFTSLEGPKEVPEGGPYEESGFGEKYVTTEVAKKGRILELTEETIYFDQTGQVLLRAQQLGEATRQERELIILGGVLDVAGSADLVANGIKFRPVYRPSGVPTALYSTANTNYLATPTPLVDWTDFDEVFQYQSTNVRDDRANAAERLPIIWNPNTVLVSRRMLGTVSRIINATQYATQPGAADASAVLVSGNPLSTVAPGITPLSSPLIDYMASLTGSQYDDARDWFVGDFKRQFIWQEIWPIQTSRARQDDDAAFRRDIVARFKVRYFGGIAALATQHVVKVNAV